MQTGNTLLIDRGQEAQLFQVERVRFRSTQQDDGSCLNRYTFTSGPPADGGDPWVLDLPAGSDVVAVYRKGDGRLRFRPLAEGWLWVKRQPAAANWRRIRRGSCPLGADNVGCPLGADNVMPCPGGSIEQQGWRCRCGGHRMCDMIRTGIAPATLYDQFGTQNFQGPLIVGIAQHQLCPDTLQ